MKNNNKIVSPQKAITSAKGDEATNLLMARFESKTIWHLAILILLPFFLYIKVTGYQLIENMDDTSIIINHFDLLKNLKNISIAFKSDAFISPTGDFYRPIQTVSFMVDAFIGGANPWIFHFTNLLYHLFTVISLYFLLRLLRFSYLTAFMATLLFSVHPLLSSAVSWIPARGDLLIGLFGVLLFITFIKYWTSNKIVYVLLHTILFTLALFSKETAVFLPALCLFYYFFLQKKEISTSIKELWPFAIAWIIPFIFYYILRSKVVIASPPSFILGFGPFINNLPAIPIVVAKLFVPIQLSTMPLFDKPFTIIGCLVLISIVFLIVKYVKEKKWLAVLGFCWFILLITPPLFFKLYYSKFIVEYYEHRTYLPLIGLIILIAFWLDELRSGKQLKPYTRLPVVLVLFFAFLTSSHSDDFKDSMAFFSNATNRGNAGACTKRGELYAQQRDFVNALNDFEKAVDLSGEQYPPALFSRGKIRSTANKDHKGSEEDFTKTILLDSTYIDAYIGRAEERVSLSNFEGALYDVAKAKQLDNTNASVYYTHAKILTSAQKFDEALPLYNKAIKMDSYSADMYNDRAYVKYRLNIYNDAIKDCDTAIHLFPQFMNAYYNKGVIYLGIGNAKLALKEFDTTLALTNNFYFGYFYRGMAKKQLNDMNGACADWNESVKLGFAAAQDTISRYCK